jgi:hypothetical protein
MLLIQTCCKKIEKKTLTQINKFFHQIPKEDILHHYYAQQFHSSYSYLEKIIVLQFCFKVIKIGRLEKSIVH